MPDSNDVVNGLFRTGHVEERLAPPEASGAPQERVWQSVDAGARGPEPDYFAPDMNEVLRESLSAGRRRLF